MNQSKSNGRSEECSKFVTKAKKLMAERSIKTKTDLAKLLGIQAPHLYNIWAGRKFPSKWLAESLDRQLRTPKNSAADAIAAVVRRWPRGTIAILEGIVFSMDKQLPKSDLKDKRSPRKT